MKIKIPKQFEIGGRVFRVYRKKRIGGGLEGQLRIVQGEIWLADEVVDSDDGEVMHICEDERLFVFMHELAHALAAEIGDGAKDGEEFADRLGALLVQVLKSWR